MRRDREAANGDFMAGGEMKKKKTRFIIISEKVIGK